MTTAQGFLQVLASGLLMGLIYALIAVGLSLIFGLMDVVNFAHGEFLMVAMYAAFGLVLMTALDPVVLTPLIVAMMFALGVLVYVGVIRYAMRAKVNQGMVQIFATFGLGLLNRPGIEISIFVGLLLIIVIALPIVWRRLREGRFA